MVISLPKIGWSIRFETRHIFRFNTKDHLSNRNFQWSKNLEIFREYNRNALVSVSLVALAYNAGDQKFKTCLTYRMSSKPD